VHKADAGDGAVIECDDGTRTIVPATPAACSVKQGSDGTKTITCSDGTKVDISDGTNGTNGKDGTTGTKGTNGAIGANGDPGKNGKNGAPAPDAGPGRDGRSAYVVGPGLKIEISDVTIPADRHPVVSLSMHDDADRPLDRTGTLTPGAVSMSFVLAYLQSENGVVGQYMPYNVASVNGVTVNNVAPVLASAMQPQSESNGTWAVVNADKGTYSYTFAAALPSGYDKTKTHTLAAYASRTFDDNQYAVDPVFNFRPDGKTVTETREVVTTETCNHCHDTLAVHGGSRRDLGLCITCHTQGMQDPESGNSIDFKQMIHKIHRGVNLPSVKGGTPYHIVGYANQDHDYSDVTFPQAMENCTACHQGGADSDHWKTRFSRDACTSCHDRTNFAATTPPGFTDHTAGAMDTDNDCAGCHHEGRAHIGPYVVDVTQVHIPQDQYPLRDENASDDPTGGHSYGDVISVAPELSGTIESVTGVQDGQTPVVTFTVGMNGAPYDILASGQALASLRFTFAAPTKDYVGYAQYTAQSSGAVGNLAAGASAGEFVWTAGNTINDIANAVGAATGSNPFPRTGTLAVGMEGSINAPATSPHGDHVASVRHAMHNQVFYVALTDAQAVPRREATVVENCNTCHADLSAHGGSRNDPEYCVMCHSAGRDTITRMPLPAMGSVATTTSLRLSHMVHRIHTGVNGTTPFIAYSPSGAIDFSDVRFPGDRRNCEHCHVPDQYQLPLPAGLLPTRYSDIDSTRARVKDYYMGPVAAACTGCHDAASTASHAAAMSVIDPSDPSAITESCDTCHASGKAFGLDAVHARPGL
jgi:OmcA/MtrC family decaheme c-type cytochrome